MEEADFDKNYLMDKSHNYIREKFSGYESKNISFHRSEKNMLIKKSEAHFFLYVDIWSEEKNDQLYLVFDLNRRNFEMVVSRIVDKIN